jgi:uncharacterized protein (TIGR02246 family)
MTSRCKTRPAAAFCACLASLLLASSCGQPAPVDTRAADEKAIRDLDAQWSRTAAANDLEGTVSFYTDDATLLPPNAPIAVGKQAIRASWASLLGPGVAVSWQVKSVEVARSGDLAYLIGTYDLTMKDTQGNPLTDRGKLLEVWKKQPDGKWKAVADTYNSDLPPAPPPPPAKKK